MLHSNAIDCRLKRPSRGAILKRALHASRILRCVANASYGGRSRPARRRTPGTHRKPQLTEEVSLLACWTSHVQNSMGQIAGFPVDVDQIWRNVLNDPHVIFVRTRLQLVR